MAVDVAVLKPGQRFDFHSYAQFRESAEAALTRKDVKRIVVDLRDVQYMDSAALGILLYLRDLAMTNGKTVELTTSYGVVRDVLEVANFAKLFKMDAVP